MSLSTLTLWTFFYRRKRRNPVPDLQTVVILYLTTGVAKYQLLSGRVVYYTLLLSPVIRTLNHADLFNGVLDLLTHFAKLFHCWVISANTAKHNIVSASLRLLQRSSVSAPVNAGEVWGLTRRRVVYINRFFGFTTEKRFGNHNCIEDSQNHILVTHVWWVNAINQHKGELCIGQ